MGIATDVIAGTGDARMEIDVLAEVPLAEAVIVPLLAAGTGRVPTVNVAHVWPAGMTTVGGRSTAGLSLPRTMVVGVGSTAVVKTVPSREFPPVSDNTGEPIGTALKYTQLTFRIGMIVTVPSLITFPVAARMTTGTGITDGWKGLAAI